MAATGNGFAYGDDPQSEQLSAYAPVQRLEIEQYHWRRQWLWLAERVQRSQQAQDWLQQWDMALQQARQQMQSWLERHETVGIYKIVSEKVYVYGNLRSMGGPLIYDGLHCEPPAQVRQQLIDTGRLNIEVPLEQLHLYAADHMIVIHYPMEHQNGTQYGAQRHIPTPVMSSALWRQLPAVRSGQVHAMDRHFFYGFDPLSQQLQLKAWMDSIASYL
jgi:AraC family transcriptional regulator, transcriptional activator for feuABC-ybbA operon